MKKTFNFAALICFAFGSLICQVKAASTSLSIIINSPPSTNISCPLQSSYTAPLAAGATVCAISIAPTGWSGALTLSGANASAFALSGSNLVVGSTPLNAGTYSVVITANP